MISWTRHVWYICSNWLNLIHEIITHPCITGVHVVCKVTNMKNCIKVSLLCFLLQIAKGFAIYTA